MKTVAITGHTQGLGKGIADYFESKGYNIRGFSRSNGYDITNPEHREQIIEQSVNADIFVNNAYDFVGGDHGQNLLLYAMTDAWFNENKTLINVSSTAGDFIHSTNPYCANKTKQDFHLKKVSFTTKKLQTINLKPSWVATERINSKWPEIAVESGTYPDVSKLEVVEIVKILDCILSTASVARITEITIYPPL